MWNDCAVLRTVLIATVLVWSGAAYAQEQSAKCLKPDGIEEPCESRHTRPVVLIIDDGGGLLSDYVDRWQKISIAQQDVEILGFCGSACTTVVAFVPKEKLCFGKDASLKFHQARESMYGPAALAMTKWMTDRYPHEIRNWINVRGGYEKIPDKGFWTLPASELWQMGYRKCNT
jgi:hypothetical protein